MIDQMLPKMRNRNTVSKRPPKERAMHQLRFVGLSDAVQKEALEQSFCHRFTEISKGSG
jgi:hypothetical protein